MNLRVLAVSDEVDNRIYSTTIRDRMEDIDLVISCGDLPASYLEFLTDALHRPVYYVLGNHAEEITREGVRGEPRHPEGCVDLGFKIVRDPTTGLIMAGLPGSPRYSERDPVQFTEFQMQMRLLRMAPKMLWNKLRYGRAFDILVTHAPPRHVGDREDPAHQGFNVMRGALQRWRPPYHLHGHIHLWDRNEPSTHRFADTDVVNVYPYAKLDLTFANVPEPASRLRKPANEHCTAAESPRAEGGVTHAE